MSSDDKRGIPKPIVATWLEGAQVVVTKILEAYEDGDTEEAFALTQVLDNNLSYVRRMFVL
jgi:hypothetical protein